MKTLSFVRPRNWKFWLFLSLVVAGFLGWKGVKHSNDYPTSKEFIDPATGKPALDMAAFVLPFMTEYDDVVSIAMGNVPGDVIKIGVLQYLSPVIRMRPKARYFKVSWDVSYPNYYVKFTLNYDRQRGMVTEEQNSWNDPSDSTRITVLGRNITDRHIHEGACVYEEYDVWAGKHWHR